MSANGTELEDDFQQARLHHVEDVATRIFFIFVTTVVTFKQFTY
jgi:hypothetical protein